MRIPLPTANEKYGTGVEKLPFKVGNRPEFIKQYEGPDAGSCIICFKFWELIPAWGCPYECTYCFLQSSPHVRFHADALRGVIYSNWRHMLNQLELWLTAPTTRMLIVGELQDGLVFDGAYRQATGKALTHHVIPLFARQKRHQLIFLTKSVLISLALELKPTPQVVFSWSINAEYAAQRWEVGAPPVRARLAAARRMKDAGWRVRLRLDPMIPYEDGDDNWQDGYGRIIDAINSLGPEMVTLGMLRATNKGALRAAAAKNGRATDLFDYLSEKDPSGFKYRLPVEQQLELYRLAVERLDRPRIKVGLCKEDVSVWEAVGLRFESCNCLLPGDRVADELVSGAGFRRLLKGKST